MTPQQTTTICGASVLLAALALTGCGRRDEADTTRTADNTAIVQGQPSTADQIARDAQIAKDATKDAAIELKDASRSAADQATNKVADAMITTSVNAELARDPKLSALHIDVDTSGGRVALKGTAPDAESRDRATHLASAVKGVVSVDNQLTVQGKG
jgi:osmotically-inducible protein OsmY